MRILHLHSGAACARLAAALALVAGLASQAYAGGYLSVSSGGVARSWSGTVTLNLDLGSLGTLGNAAADTLSTNAATRWANSSISTCSLAFATGTDLPVDVTSSNFNTYLNEGAPDGRTPIVYDVDGTITDAMIGAGAGNQVLGFAGPVWLSGNTITEGRAVLNGRFIDGNSTSPNPEVTQAQFEGVIAHELGHMLNLDHSQANDAFVNVDAFHTADFVGYPTMYPLVHDDIADLEIDDQYWISSLYPHSSFTTGRTALTGVVRNAGGSLINGVNVVARRADDDNAVVTCVSGYLDGTPTISPDGIFRLPGLPAGTAWVLDVEPIQSGFTGGSSVGPIDPPLTMPGPAEFFSETGTESNSDALNRSTTFVTGAGGSTTSGVDFRFNTTASGSSYAEGADAGGTFTTHVQVASSNLTPGNVLTITGGASPGTGNLDFLGGDPIEDWYSVAGTAEITKVTMTSTNDCDLYLMAFDGVSQVSLVGYSLNEGGSESWEVPIRLSSLGGGGSAGRLYIGVSAYTGEAAGTYTITVTSSLDDQDSLAIASVGTFSRGTGLNTTITGRGFSNSGGNPTVTLSDANITVNTVTFVNSGQLTVNYTTTPSFTPGTTNVTVANANGIYSGFFPSVTTVPVELSGFALD